MANRKIDDTSKKEIFVRRIPAGCVTKRRDSGAIETGNAGARYLRRRQQAAGHDL